MKKTTKPPILPTRKLTFYPVVETAVAQKAFLDSVKIKDDGTNAKSNLEGFLRLADDLLKYKPYFSLDDALYANSSQLGLDCAYVTRMFNLWTEKLVACGKLQSEQSCYGNLPLFVVV